jgi:tRNA U55 pseudouridine synthase TruB
LADLVQAQPKTYVAQIALGAATRPTMPKADVIATAAVPPFDLEAVLPRFVGDILQVPPAYWR